MKVIFIFNLAYKSPFFYELVDKLHKSGREVVVYDFISSKKFIPSTKKTYSLNPFFGAKLILKIRYFRRLFIPLINRKIIKKEFNLNDIVNFHYMHRDYVKYANVIQNRVSKLIVTFWGSDYLRASDKTILEYEPLLDKCDIISMVEGIQGKFKKSYPSFKDKVRTSYFGLNQLDLIKDINIQLIEEFKKKYALTNDKIFVTIGYNASPAQQHLLLLEKINSLPDVLKKKIHILAPLTYGGDQNYKHEVINKLSSSKISFTTFTSFLNETDLATLRRVSNITLNIQKTDAFSGSMSESIMAQNIVLVGDWLPYDVYDTWGVKIFRESLHNFEARISDVIINYEYYSKQIIGNSLKVYQKLSWKFALSRWQNIFDE